MGIPQGSPLSSVLSNIYLIDFDKMMHEKAKEEGFIYRRYCDDILIISETNKADELQKFAIARILKDHGLEIQPMKVEIIDFHYNSRKQIRGFKREKGKLSIPVTSDANNEQRFYKSLQYLGFEFNGQDIFIRSSSLSKYFRKMKGRIDKTVKMAYSPNGKLDKVFKRQLFERYSHMGDRNFISYAMNASKEKYQTAKGEWKNGMNSPAMRKQISRHFMLLMSSLEIKNNQRFMKKVIIKKKKI